MSRFATNKEKGEELIVKYTRHCFFEVMVHSNGSNTLKNLNFYLEAWTTSLLVTGCVWERSCTLLRRLSMAAFRERGLGTPPSDVLSSSCIEVEEN